MIPSMNSILTTEIEVETEGTKNYQMHFTEKFINGFVDELKAMHQVIYKILNTERYQYIIYSWNYGIETLDLFGEPISYVCPEIERRIIEALTQDDRIESVDNFEFDYSEKGKLHVTFSVHTIYGDLEEERVVNY
uniref:DUF2634 domain-containing protein n=2 Tax=unclassified Caudoviricetes TaxID=2788787 RepID=A0A8S5MAB5_9CAUD|nr:MAG TPA: Protein of unknown function (DUF2634) [Siphoviridae sp. ctsDY37]DAF96004.1 MAG TPA: Protein of unknown function (DUF2634) [Siphoviridae sp. cteLB10]